MAEHRRPEYRIAIAGPGFRRVSELYPAELFPGGQGLSDRYRVRLNRVWHRPGGMRYALLPLDEALPVSGWGHGPNASRPDLSRGCRVRVPIGRSGLGEGDRLHESTVTMTDPFQGPDGRWRVFVVGKREPILVDDLERKD